MRLENDWEDVVTTWIVIIAVAIAYLALGGLSSALAYASADAWTVWLASGLVLGLLLACRRERWSALLVGAALGVLGVVPLVITWAGFRPERSLKKRESESS